MRDRRLRLLLATRPAWFVVTDAGDKRATGTAGVEINALDSVSEHDLEIVCHRDAVRVRETKENAKLPGRCAERHIEFDGWFCLGLEAGSAIDNQEAGSIWWERLRRFLRLQRTATRNGIWPDQHALAHGDAGAHHQAAIAIAADLGLSEEYEAMVLSRPSRLSAALPLIMRKADCYRNGRAACSCGCEPLKGRPRLRRNCSWLRAALPLLLEERLRQRKLTEFWRGERAKGTVCCRTMKTCPLQQAA